MCSTCLYETCHSVGTLLAEEFLIIVHDVVDYHPECHSIFEQPARCSFRQALGGLIFAVVKGVFQDLSTYLRLPISGCTFVTGSANTTHVQSDGRSDQISGLCVASGRNTMKK